MYSSQSSNILPVNTDGEPGNYLEAEQLQLPRPDLTDTPYNSGLRWCVDCSCSKTPAGKNQTGYAIVSLPDEVIEARRLPPDFSAQAERACILAKGKKITVYTDSRYAFSTLFYFAKHWDRRGIVTSTGKPITHSAILRDLLQAVLLPVQIAMCKCPAHTSC